MRNPSSLPRALVETANVTPPWLLVFLRLAKAAQGDYAKAWKSLPDHLPKGTRCPTIVEGAAILALHNLV